MPGRGWEWSGDRSRQRKDARKTFEERSQMRAGTWPWLRPKFNSVDVVKMMAEGETKKR